MSKNDYTINDSFYFSKKENLKELQKLLDSDKDTTIAVKNGYATLADKVFVDDFKFSSPFIKTTLKASRDKWTKMFYPYDEKGNLIKEENYQFKNSEEYTDYYFPLLKDSNLITYSSKFKDTSGSNII